jgi:hypothetical protein
VLLLFFNLFYLNIRRKKRKAVQLGVPKQELVAQELQVSFFFILLLSVPDTVPFRFIIMMRIQAKENPVRTAPEIPYITGT